MINKRTGAEALRFDHLIPSVLIQLTIATRSQHDWKICFKTPLCNAGTTI